ncbi:hypothetical protein AcidC75_05320 [Acidisoma sp. C75]
MAADIEDVIGVQRNAEEKVGVEEVGVVAGRGLASGVAQNKSPMKGARPPLPRRNKPAAMLRCMINLHR